MVKRFQVVYHPMIKFPVVFPDAIGVGQLQHFLADGFMIPFVCQQVDKIAGGKSRYQIARQPRYKKKCPVLQNRRGDITLLINGMPVIHIELKRSDTPISKATHQIEEYSHEGIFTGIFSPISKLYQLDVKCNILKCTVA